MQGALRDFTQKGASGTRVLLHACCGVCFSYPLIVLREINLEPVVHYFNPNIYPAVEFERRYAEVEKYCGKNSVKLIKTPYLHETFLGKVSGLENQPERGERCKKCFYIRLKTSSLLAFELGITKITTTLTVSPHKTSKDIFEAGANAVSDSVRELNLPENSIEFIKMDFKKKDGFKKSSKIAYDFGMYRQNYCGCEFSMSALKIPAINSY